MECSPCKKCGNPGFDVWYPLRPVFDDALSIVEYTTIKIVCPVCKNYETKSQSNEAGHRNGKTFSNSSLHIARELAWEEWNAMNKDDSAYHTPTHCPKCNIDKFYTLRQGDIILYEATLWGGGLNLIV